MFAIKRSAKSRIVFFSLLILTILAFSILFQINKTQQASLVSARSITSPAASSETCNWSRTCRVSVEVEGTGRSRALAMNDAIAKCAAAVQFQLYNNFMSCYRDAVTACVAPCYTGIQPVTVDPCSVSNCELIPYEDRNETTQHSYRCVAEAYGSAKITCALELTHHLY